MFNRSSIALFIAVALCACSAHLDDNDDGAYTASADALTFAESGGLVSMEAEAFTATAAGSGSAAGARWTRTTALASASDGAAMLATPNSGVRTSGTNGPRLDFTVTLAQAGTYYVWVRLRGTSYNDDSVQVGIDGKQIGGGAYGVFDTSGSWHWEQYDSGRRLSFTVSSAGAHRFSVWMREDGVAVDKIVLARSSSYVPSGNGPAMTPASDGAAGGGGAGAAGSTSGGTGGAGSGGSAGGAAGAGSGGAGSGGAGGAGSGGAGGAGSGGSGGGACLSARRLWSDDWELGNYSRWSSQGYVSGLNEGGCYEARITTERAHSGTRSHKASIACASSANHRIYGGMQFSGDTPLTGYTNTGSGIDAPGGLVISYWSWLEAPGGFDYDGRWFSFFTAENACDWSDDVLGFGLEDPTHRLVPAHVLSTGGSVTYAPTRAAFPFGRWVHTSVYLNYYTGVMQAWQDGALQFTASFRRNTNRICHFHWGLYAGGVNTSLTLFEDDFSIHKLDAPATFTSEPVICP